MELYNIWLVIKNYLKQCHIHLISFIYVYISFIFDPQMGFIVEMNPMCYICDIWNISLISLYFLNYVLLCYPYLILPTPGVTWIILRNF